MGNLFVGGTDRHGPADYEILNHPGEALGPVLNLYAIERVWGSKIALWAQGVDFVGWIYNKISIGKDLTPQSGGLQFCELYPCFLLLLDKLQKDALFEDQIELYEQHIHAVYYQQEHLPKRVRLFIEFLTQKLSKFR